MQKIAELNSRFCEQQPGPVSGLGGLLESLAGTAVGFRFLFYGRWADGKRWLGCPNSWAGATVGPLVSPGWLFSASGLEPSLQRGAVHKSRGRQLCIMSLRC